MLTTAESQQHITMAMAIAAENPLDNITDFPPDFLTLTEGYDITDMRWLAYSLASAAATLYLPAEYRGHPGALPLAGQALRAAAFNFAAKEAAGE